MTGAVETLPEVEVVEVAAESPRIVSEEGRAASGAVTWRGFDGEGRRLNFADALGDVPGVWMASLQGGEIAKISIRGSGIQSDETLGVHVLMDGLAYNQGDGEANLEEIDPGAIAAARIYRGAHAFRHTGLVLGGAIDLVAKTGRNSPGTAAVFERGGFGYGRAQASYGAVRGPWDGFTSAAAKELHGFREHSVERVRTAHANFGYTRDARIEHRLYLGFADWQREIAGMLTTEEAAENPRQADEEALENDYRIETRSWRVADRVTWNGPEGRIEGAAFFHRREFLLVDEYEADYRLGVTDAYSNNVGVRVAWERAVEIGGRSHAFAAGVFAVHEREVSENFRNEGGRVDRATRTAAGTTRGLSLPFYFEDRVNLDERWALDLGAQYVHITRRFEDRFFEDAGGDASAEQRFKSFNPKVGLVYVPRDGVTWFGNVSRSFQPPSFDDLNLFEEGENGSVVYRALNAQRARTWELGGRGERGPWQWEVAAYRSDLRNELLELADEQGRELGTVNAARTRHQGVEVGVELTLGEATESRGWRGGQTYAWSDFRFVDDPVYGRNRIAGVPVHLASSSLEYRNERGLSGEITLEGSASRYPADQANTLFVDAQLALSVRLAWRSRNGWEVFAEVRNATDEQFIEMVEPMADARAGEGEEARIFSPAAGRAVYVGVAWRG